MSELYTYSSVGDGVKNHGKICVSSEWLTEGRASPDNPRIVIRTCGETEINDES